MEGHSTTPVLRRIVFTTFGSLGDLHPYIAIVPGLYPPTLDEER